MFFIAYFLVVLLVLSNVFRIGLIFNGEFDVVGGFERIISRTCGGKACNDSNIEEGWGHHPTFEVEC
ncbi:hypothetical protein A2U01_0076784, partial [Trifolium medium]|nr:hypothetical protein [Trifolium medium]